jgi:hypothetical protein
MGSRKNILETSAVALALLVAGCSDEAYGRCEQSSRSGSKRIVVTTSLTFVVPVDGVSDGFDVDHTTSDSTDTLSCGRSDFVSPDGVEGIDNQFAALWSILVNAVGGAVEGLIETAINEGRLLLMFQIDGIDDPLHDDCVNVHIYNGSGRPELGTDGTIAPSQTFDVQEGTPHTWTRGRIADGVLEAGPFDVVIPIAIFDVVADLELHGGYVRATFDEQGGMNATIGGGVENEQVMDVARMAAENDGTAQQLVPLLPIVLGANSDLGYDADEDECTQLSTVMSFTATPAYLFEDATDPTL